MLLKNCCSVNKKYKIKLCVNPMFTAFTVFLFYKVLLDYLIVTESNYHNTYLLVVRIRYTPGKQFFITSKGSLISQVGNSDTNRSTFIYILIFCFHLIFAKKAQLI